MTSDIDGTARQLGRQLGLTVLGSVPRADGVGLRRASVTGVHDSGGTLTVDLALQGGVWANVPCTTACSQVQTGDRVIVETISNVSIVTGIIARADTARLAPKVDDTGWITPPLTDNTWAYNTDYPLRIRRVGDRVYLQGGVMHTAHNGVFQPQWRFWNALEPKFRPNRRVIVGTFYFTTVFWDVNVDGTIRAQSSNADSPGHTILFDTSWTVN